ncbi:MAG: hypothetical protein WB586_26345 [Chthoniobacterales bacterium]
MSADLPMQIFSIFALLFLLVLTSIAAGSDQRFGLATHFDRQNTDAARYGNYLHKQFVQEGVAWIRDDINWGLDEPTQGKFILEPTKQQWIDAAAAAGLGIVGLIDENVPTFYGGPGWTNNPAIIKATANFAAFWAKAQAAKGYKIVIEVINEAQNYRAFQGPSGERLLFDLTNAVADAVHAAAPEVPVIGIDEQGDQILRILALGPARFDGVVYHPYDPGNWIPEHTWEPTKLLPNVGGGAVDYLAWVKLLKSKTSLPLWETERAISDKGREGEYWSAVWEARRTIASYWGGVAHTFMYEGCSVGGDDKQSFLSFNQEPRQATFVHQRLSAELPASLIPSTTAPTEASPDSNSKNFKGLAFVTGTTANPTNTIAAVFYQNQMDAGVPKVNNVSIRIFQPGATSVKAVNVVRGTTQDMLFTMNKNYVVVSDVPLSIEPVLLEVSTAGPKPTPTPPSTPSSKPRPLGRGR